MKGWNFKFKKHGHPVISNDQIKTPESILYPYAIKTHANSTKLITISNQLGHGVSASILEVLATENAIRVLENQLDNSVLLNGVSKEVFAMTVHDNIDRNKETLTDKSKLSSSLKIDFCSLKCNSIATRFCYFLCNGIEEIISYHYILF